MRRLNIPNDAEKKNMYVCSRHFSVIQIASKKLAKGAVPDQNLCDEFKSDQIPLLKNNSQLENIVVQTDSDNANENTSTTSNNKSAITETPDFQSGKLSYLDPEEFRSEIVPKSHMSDEANSQQETDEELIRTMMPENYEPKVNVSFRTKHPIIDDPLAISDTSLTNELVEDCDDNGFVTLVSRSTQTDISFHREFTRSVLNLIANNTNLQKQINACIREILTIQNKLKS